MKNKIRNLFISVLFLIIFSVVFIYSTWILHYLKDLDFDIWFEPLFICISVFSFIAGFLSFIFFIYAICKFMDEI